MPVEGKPIGLPITASASSTSRPSSTDAIGDEARRIETIDDSLAEFDIGELPQRVELRALGADDFQQPHIARRVEEMRDAEIVFQRRRHPRRKLAQRNGGGVGGDDRAWLAHRGDLLIERLFDVQPLDHGLDDPVGLGKLAHIVFNVAGRDQPRRAASHQRRRVHLRQPLDRAAGDRAAVGSTGFHDIEQHHSHTGIGAMGGDARPHHAGADHRDGFNVGHQIASSTVAMPCPPPMHCVASA
jgi:hypothetical protein